MTNEFERIAKLSAIFSSPQHATSSPVVVGIGDDAAVLTAPADQHLVWTIDACVQDVHFREDIVNWHDVGYRSFMAAASDLAAMSARPLGALSSITLPKSLPEQVLMDIAHGQHEAARQLATAIVGGNLASSQQVTISTTLLGYTRCFPTRHDARIGHVIAVFGAVGLAAAGLQLLLQNYHFDPHDQACLNAIEAWRRPVAYIEAGLRCQNASSLIDISDGLVQDAMHLAQASSVRIDLDPHRLVCPALEHVAKIVRKNAIDLILTGGEDYALLATFAPDRVPEGFVVIGQCCKGQGVWIDGKPCHAAGYDHFG